MEKPFFSVLIPVYNVEKYIDQCLRSIIDQSFEDYEVIMMDDGSPDSSVEICKNYSNRDNRFKLYHQVNKGLLLTRRELFKLADGKYIISLDSDDFFQKDILSTLYKTIQKHDCDMVLFRHLLTDEKGDKIGESKVLFPKEKVFDLKNKEEILRVFFTSSSINSMCFKTVKKEIIDINEDYSRYKDVKGEDALQSIALFKNASKIVSINNCLSNYRSAQNNRSNNFKIKYLNNLFLVRGKVYDFLLEQQNLYDKYLDEFLDYFLATLRIYLSQLIDKVKINNFKEIIDNINNEKLLHIAFDRAERLNKLNRLLIYFIRNQKVNQLLVFIKSYKFTKLTINKIKNYSNR